MAAASEVFEQAYLDILERFSTQKPGRREILRWAVETGHRYASAREGFVGPVLGLRRRLADLLVHRKTRQALGGRLRQAITRKPLPTEQQRLFEAAGIELTASGELVASGRWATSDS